ncbi:MAG TPA: hypothetical protein VN999_05990 [Thermoanaerobaculia bacterium]|nr:hypothetical protein [Thermoanaerobaculia bacterium]
MEWVIVVFPGNRSVIVDGRPFGHTNENLEITRGTYTFSLGDPQDYSPPERQLLVHGTNILNPLKVTFARI